MTREDTTQPKIGSWIPITDRLPEEFVSVLVCFKSQGGMAQCVTERIVGFLDGSTRWSGMCGQVPVTWMPLPKPYNEESEDDIDNMLKHLWNDYDKEVYCDRNLCFNHSKCEECPANKKE